MEGRRLSCPRPTVYKTALSAGRHRQQAKRLRRARERLVKDILASFHHRWPVDSVAAKDKAGVYRASLGG